MIGGHFQIRPPPMPAIDIPITIETTNVRVDRETTPSVTLAIQVCTLACNNDIVWSYHVRLKMVDPFLGFVLDG